MAVGIPQRANIVAFEPLHKSEAVRSRLDDQIAICLHDFDWTIARSPRYDGHVQSSLRNDLLTAVLEDHSWSAALMALGIQH